MAVGTEMMARAEELGTLLSREEGKPLAEGKGEVYRAGQFFTYYAAETLRQMGETADSVRDGIEIDVRREAVGMVAVIFPRGPRLGKLCQRSLMTTQLSGSLRMLLQPLPWLWSRLLRDRIYPRGLSRL